MGADGARTVYSANLGEPLYPAVYVFRLICDDNGDDFSDLLVYFF